MELRTIIKKIKKYKLSLLASLVVGALLGIGIYFLPPKYVATGSFYIKRGISNQTGYFTYEGYYSQQTALAYTNSVIALLDSLDVKKMVLDKMKIESTEKNLRWLSRIISVKKTGPQLISVTVKGKTYAQAQTIWNKLSETLLVTTFQLNKDSDPNLMVTAVSSQPVVKTTYKSLVLFGTAGVLLSLTLFSFFICIKEYLKD
jgi:capsular polysaccharide biosynthesis protein